MPYSARSCECERPNTSSASDGHVHEGVRRWSRVQKKVRIIGKRKEVVLITCVNLHRLVTMDAHIDTRRKCSFHEAAPPFVSRLSGLGLEDKNDN